jgi:RND family efflux transporter MFP subunit
MKNNVLMLMLIALVAWSCSGTMNDTTKLEDLKMQRTVLDKQIQDIENKIIANGGAVSEIIKIPTVVGQKITTEPFKHFIEVRGIVESDNNIFVPALRPYLVKKIYVKVGDQVSKGQLMAQLDDESISQTIREIKNGLELATTMFNRQKNLYDKNIGTEVQYLQSKTAMEDLQIKLKNAESELDKSRIYSPIDGLVDFIAIKEGEAAIPNMGAIRVSNLTALKVKAKMSENHITNIKRGDKIKVYLPILDETIDASISAVSQVIDPNNRTFDIEVLLPDDDRISHNMLAVLNINDYTNPSAFILPINALQRDETRKYVYVAQKENDYWLASLRDVETGKYSKDKVEIIRGLNENEVVITFGFNNISVGKPVQISFQEL